MNKRTNFKKSKAKRYDSQVNTDQLPKMTKLFLHDYKIANQQTRSYTPTKVGWVEQHVISWFQTQTNDLCQADHDDHDLVDTSQRQRFQPQLHKTVTSNY
jgi:hypothetical protein